MKHRQQNATSRDLKNKKEEEKKKKKKKKKNHLVDSLFTHGDSRAHGNRSGGSGKVHAQRRSQHGQTAKKAHNRCHDKKNSFRRLDAFKAVVSLRVGWRRTVSKRQKSQNGQRERRGQKQTRKHHQRNRRSVRHHWRARKAGFDHLAGNENKKKKKKKKKKRKKKKKKKKKKKEKKFFFEFLKRPHATCTLPSPQDHSPKHNKQKQSRGQREGKKKKKKKKKKKPLSVALLRAPTAQRRAKRASSLFS
jgi:hypothetical protein